MQSTALVKATVNYKHLAADTGISPDYSLALNHKGLTHNEVLSSLKPQKSTKRKEVAFPQTLFLPLRITSKLLNSK